MFVTSHRGYCCGINELRDIRPGDLTKGGLYDAWSGSYSWYWNMQYRVHCPHEKRAWMEPELVTAGFTLLATNSSETIWGFVGRN